MKALHGSADENVGLSARRKEVGMVGTNGKAGRACQRRKQVYFVLAGILIACIPFGCTKENSKPTYELQDSSLPTTCGRYLVTISGEDRIVVWDWEDLQKTPLQGPGAGLYMASGKVVASIDSPDQNPIVVLNLAGDEEYKRWNLGPEWYCDEMRASANGKFVVIEAYEDTSVSGKPGHPRTRLGLIGPKAEEIRWVVTVTFKVAGPTISGAVPSEDGRLIAAVGINDGGWILVADTAAKKVLWEKVPEWAVGFDDVAFSPDAKVVYAGGGSGVVYAFEVATGKILSKWLIGDGKEVQYPHRISSVAASLDGRLVAAGTGPRGEVYVWDARSGTREAVFNTKQVNVLILAFSPDSSFLATSGVVAGSSIKIWTLPSAKAPAASEN